MYLLIEVRKKKIFKGFSKSYACKWVNKGNSSQSPTVRHKLHRPIYNLGSVFHRLGLNSLKQLQEFSAVTFHLQVTTIV